MIARPAYALPRAMLRERVRIWRLLRARARAMPRRAPAFADDMFYVVCCRFLLSQDITLTARRDIRGAMICGDEARVIVILRCVINNHFSRYHACATLLICQHDAVDMARAVG